jgi:geranylgeranyl diphosphate synthase type I
MIRYHFGYEEAAAGEARRGKRLRPQLLLQVTLEEGGTVDSAIDAAVAIEILHNYSLVHDDIEDSDELRHGRRTIWSRFGVAHGINVGDAMCALSYLALLRAENGLPSDRVTKMMNVLHDANLAMCEGQGSDIRFETEAVVSMDDYLAMISGKTGALFAASCELGARAAGVSESRAAAYATFGAAYGRAFQIRDDVLGTWGAPDLTGKPSGADIARRKWSFPVVWALGSAPSADRSIIESAYAPGSKLGEGGVRDVIAALERLGARDAADDAHDAALAGAERVAEEEGLDRNRSLRDMFLRGARRVA